MDIALANTIRRCSCWGSIEDPARRHRQGDLRPFNQARPYAGAWHADSEQAIVGAAIGASMVGMKPVAEIMIDDFAMVCMDQIADRAAKLRYMSGGRTSVPITLRMLTAGKVGSFGAQHSQSLEAWFAHIPGLKIVAPSNAYDAKGMLLSAIDDPDPVIFLEAMRCFFVPGFVPEADYRVPLRQSDNRTSGQGCDDHQLQLDDAKKRWLLRRHCKNRISTPRCSICGASSRLISLAWSKSVGRTGRAFDRPCRCRVWRLRRRTGGDLATAAVGTVA